MGIPAELSTNKGELFFNRGLINIDHIDRIYLDRYPVFYLAEANFICNSYGNWIVSLVPGVPTSLNTGDSYSYVNKLVVDYEEYSASCTLELNFSEFIEVSDFLVERGLVSRERFENEMSKLPFGYRAHLYPMEIEQDLDFHVEFGRMLQDSKTYRFSRVDFSCLEIKEGRLVARDKPISSSTISLVQLHYSWRTRYSLTLEVSTSSGRSEFVAIRNFYHFVHVLDYLVKNRMVDLQKFYRLVLEGPGATKVLYRR